MAMYALGLSFPADRSAFANNVCSCGNYTSVRRDNISTNVSYLAYCDEQACSQDSSNNAVMIPLPQVINHPPIFKIVTIYMYLSSFWWHTINQTPRVNFSPTLPILT